MAPPRTGAFNRLALVGSRFRGISGASGGGTNDSTSDYPLVQIRRIDSGLEAIVAQPELVAAFQSTASDAGFYDQTEHDANGAVERTAGQNEVIDAPYNFPGLVSKIQDLNVGARLIGYDPGTGKYTLTITLMRASTYRPRPLRRSRCRRLRRRSTHKARWSSSSRAWRPPSSSYSRRSRV